MKECVFKGCATALVTPFTDDNEVDFGTLSQLIDYQLAEGADAIVSLGTTGEASTLTDFERKEILKFTLKKVNGKIPVIAGAGSNNTRRAAELGKMMEKSGADALLHVTPYYNKTNSEGLERHFAVQAESVKIPIILYNVPSRTGVTLTPEVCGKLSEYENIVGIKDAGGDVRKISEYHTLAGKDFSVYSGNDDIILPTLACGGMGVISVLSNIVPGDVSKLCRSFFDGDMVAARSLQEKYSRLVSLLFAEPNPMPVKYALSLMNMGSEKTRLPLWKISDENKKLIKEEMVKLNIIKR